MEYKPHEYQKYCEDRIVAENNLGLFLEMGLGKTVITLSAIVRLKYDRFEVKKVLIIAPKKVAEGTWTGEARKWDHLSVLRISTVLGSEQQRIRALEVQADIYVISRDNVVWLTDHYKTAWPFDMVVVDELSSFKNPSAKRFRALRAMLPKVSRMIGLTGTPAPNSLQDLWAQIYLLDRGARLGKTITWYREQYFKHNPYTHEFKPLAGAQEVVYASIRDICISLSSADYIKLPDMIVDDIPVALDPVAMKAYKRMERDMLLDVQEDTITAASAAALTNKLLQLCSGAVYTEDHRAVPVHECKIEALQELIEGLHGEHALLFYGYRYDIPRLLAAAAAADPKLRVRMYEGPADADAWNAGDIDVLLAHPASCAYGLNLQHGGHHIIWYGLTWSLEQYMQANARLHRQGQDRPVIVHRLLVQGGVDEDVVAALEGKYSAQDALMIALKAKIRELRAVA